MQNRKLRGQISNPLHWQEKCVSLSLASSLSQTSVLLHSAKNHFLWLCSWQFEAGQVNMNSVSSWIQIIVESTNTNVS